MRATVHDAPRSAFRRAARAALQDESTHAAVLAATDRLREGRLAAWAELRGVDPRREQAREIRSRTVSRLRDNLARFTEAAERTGASVRFCRTGGEAVGHIVDLCTRSNATLAAKSKSMLTEEIGLNGALELAGVRVVETDLGEYLNQLAGDPPVHIITPALGKTASDAAALLSRAAGREVEPELAELTATARRLLREVFLTADVGITGVNFGVVETGSLCLTTNEGNARLVTSLPRMHIAVMGMERLVPSLEDLAVMLSLLGRSATGQSLTSYTTLITGPRRQGESDGPDELHIVVVDNGRSALQGTAYEEMLHCIRCGSCLNVCPVYRNAGGRAYGGVYSGPMGAVLVPLLRGLAAAPDLPHASSLCGACVDACPVLIPIPELLLRLRADLVETKVASLPERLAVDLWALVWSSTLGYRASASLARLLQPLARVVAPHVSSLSGRTLPTIADRCFRDTWKS